MRGQEAGTTRPVGGIHAPSRISLNRRCRPTPAALLLQGWRDRHTTPLRDILIAAPAHDAMTLCANSIGRPWTESGFRAPWRTLRVRLERAGHIGPTLTLYGLRRTVAVILRECGFGERTIADALGQKKSQARRAGSESKPQDAGCGRGVRIGGERTA